MAGGDPRPLAERHPALDDAFEFADVARPVVLDQDVQGIAGEADDVLAELQGEAASGSTRRVARCRCRGAATAGALSR